MGILLAMAALATVADPKLFTLIEEKGAAVMTAVTQALNGAISNSPVGGDAQAVQVKNALNAAYDSLSSAVNKCRSGMNIVKSISATGIPSPCVKVDPPPGDITTLGDFVVTYSETILPGGVTTITVDKNKGPIWMSTYTGSSTRTAQF